MSNDILKQRCLQILNLHHELAPGVSSRVVADELDISIYQTRLLLLKLQEEGLVREVPGRKPGRGSALHWEVSDAASSAES